MRALHARLVALESSVSRGTALWLCQNWAWCLEEALVQQGIVPATRQRILTEWRTFWEHALVPMPVLMSERQALEVGARIMQALHRIALSCWPGGDISPLWWDFAERLEAWGEQQG